jgi:hypothetical protein
MSAKFTSEGDIKVYAGINYVRLRMIVQWSDSAQIAGLALKRLSLQSDDREVVWSRSDGDSSGKADRKFIISGNRDSVKEVNVKYEAQGTSLEIDKKSDRRLVFYDGDGDDRNVIITLEILESVPFEDIPIEGPLQERVTCPPGPWSQQPTPPVCGSPPNGVSSPDGLQISKTGQNEITLNLKNYANQLVTLRITHSVDSTWTQSFGFSIPTCSDINPDPGGAPYAKSSYFNPNITGTNIFYVYNVDGGNYNYKFTHSSIPGPAPTRQLYTEYCPPPSGDPPTSPPCYCVPAGIETFSPWPYCPTGVAVSKNGGNKVQWQYEDGGGGNYDDQYVTVEVIGVPRSVIGDTGAICTSLLKSNVWVPDPNQLDALGSPKNPTGNCLGDYRAHTEKIRFRIPSLQKSKTSLPDPVCHSNFRGIAGAIPPSQSLGTLSSNYSVLHIFNDNFNTTTSLITSSGLTVTPRNEADNTQDAPDTLERKHYEIVIPSSFGSIGNINQIQINVGQNVTAGGITAPITVTKTEMISGENAMRAWFSTSYSDIVEFTDDIIHVFDDNEEEGGNATNLLLSKLVNPNVIRVIPEKTDDPGGGELNTMDKKNYLIIFTDGTKVEAGGANIDIIVNANRTASGVTLPISVSKKERIDEGSLRVWFTTYNNSAPAGLEKENTFVYDWSVRRQITSQFSGNVFARNWYLSKAN